MSNIVKEIDREGVFICINSFIINFNPYVSLIKNSEGFDIKIVETRDHTQNEFSKTRQIDWCIIVKSPSLIEPIISCIVSSLLTLSEPVEENKSLWILFDECLILLSEEIHKRMVCDKYGILLSVGDRNKVSSYQFDYLFSKN